MTTNWQKARRAAEDALLNAVVNGEGRSGVLENILSAFLSHGYQLVPVEPTGGMQKAGSQEHGLIWSIDDDGMMGCMDYDGCANIYAAMLTAAKKDMG